MDKISLVFVHNIAIADMIIIVTRLVYYHFPNTFILFNGQDPRTNKIAVSSISMHFSFEESKFSKQSKAQVALEFPQEPMLSG